MTRPRLGIIIASTRPGRVGLPVGQWLHERAQAHGGFEAQLLDLAEIALPFFDEPNHPRLGQYLHDHTRAWSATVAAQDALVMVTPEYNHGFNAPLKNAIDYLWAEWQHKPVGFVAYGGVAAGTRAIQMLKPVLAVLKMVPMVDSVPIPSVSQLVADGRFTSNDSLDRAATVMLDELLRWEAALRPLRSLV